MVKMARAGGAHLPSDRQVRIVRTRRHVQRAGDVDVPDTAGLPWRNRDRGLAARTDGRFRSTSVLVCRFSLRGAFSFEERERDARHTGRTERGRVTGSRVTRTRFQDAAARSARPPNEKCPSGGRGNPILSIAIIPRVRRIYRREETSTLC